MKVLLKQINPYYGGIELIGVMVYAFIFMTRSHFFYYVAVSGIEQMVTL